MKNKIQPKSHLKLMKLHKNTNHASISIMKIKAYKLKYILIYQNEGEKVNGKRSKHCSSTF